MKHSLAELLRCAQCGQSLQLETVEATDPVKTGRLRCVCGAHFEIVGGIPRFVSDDNYAQSFGFQWNLHRTTQSDCVHSTDMSEARFFSTTRWSRDLAGQRLLEAGSGAGRFTAIAASTGAEVFSFDFSNAVNANFANNGTLANVHVLQADIYRIPFAADSFDKVVCLGVLQHCPDPHGAFRVLVEQLAPNGQIAVDVYSRKLRSFLHPKFWLRPITKRMPQAALHRTVQRAVTALLPVKRWLSDDMPFGQYLAYLVPVAYQQEWRERVQALDERHLWELSVLDTFDWYSPAHDHPQTLAAVRRWFVEAGLTDIEVAYGPNGVIGRGTKR